MTKRVIIYGLLLSIVAAVEVSAQKYPERRVARDGNKLYYGGAFAEAEAAYGRALESDPDMKEARFNLGNAMFREQKSEEAAKVYSTIASDSLTVLAEPSLAAAANFNLGNTLLAGQNIDGAIEAYKQALRIDPTDMQAKYNLAYAQKLKQQQEQNQDQDQDQQQNDQGGGGSDQNQDQNPNGEDPGDPDNSDNDGDKPQNDDPNDPQDNGEGQNDDKDNDEGNEPPPSGQGQGGGEATIGPDDARHMLDAMQGEEDKTREKINAKEVPAVGRSGKNW